jgi:ABC-2 type transport system permease protein
MNILVQELKRSFRSWLYFTLGMAATVILFGAFFNSLKADVQLMNRLLQNFPPEFKAAFGFADVDLSKIEGYFSFISSYIVLIGAVFGMKQGVSLLSEEGRRHTVDFLLTKPVRRVRILTAKFAAIMINLVTQNLVLLFVGIVMIRLIVGGSLDVGLFALLSFSTFFVQLFFVGIGLTIAALAQKIKSVMPITLGVVFFFFIIELVNESLRDVKLSYLTPFAYFKGSGIISAHGYNTTYLLVDLAVFAVFTAIGYWIYQKKDFCAA